MEIQWRRPELSDKELITSYYKKYPSRNCERTFTNSYLWSRRYKVTFAIVENALVFRMGDAPFTFSHPAGEKEDMKREGAKLLKEIKDLLEEPILMLA